MRSKALSAATVAITTALTVFSPLTAQAVQPNDKLDAVFYGMDWKNVEQDMNRFNTDIIMFGHRIYEFKPSEFPKDLVNRIPKNTKAYFYTEPEDFSLSGIEKYKASDNRTYFINKRTPGITIITREGWHATEKMIENAKKRGLDVYAGLPQQEHYKTGSTYLPDHTFTKANEVATQMVVDKFKGSAKGFYLTTEMPIRDSYSWKNVYDIYSMQTRIVNKSKPGGIVLVSPYLDLKKDSRGNCWYRPSEYEQGARKLLSLANGTNMLLMPQDGLGVGTSALKVDRSSNHCGTTEEAFAAMQRGAGNRLLVNLEAMRPGYITKDGKKVRKASDIRRFDQQNEASSPYVAGKISYRWNNTSLVEKKEVGLRGMVGIDKYLGKGGGNIARIAEEAKKGTKPNASAKKTFPSYSYGTVTANKGRYVYAYPQETVNNKKSKASVPGNFSFSHRTVGFFPGKNTINPKTGELSISPSVFAPRGTYHIDVTYRDKDSGKRGYARIAIQVR